LKRLKIILQSKYLFKILVLLFLLLDIIFTCFYPFKSKYDKNETKFIGIVTKYELKENKIIIELKAKEKLIVNYKYQNKKINNLSYGDKLLVKGSLKEPSTTNIPNTFNYKNYLYNKKIYYLVEASSIDKLENNKNYFYTTKNIIYEKINKLKSSNYIKTLLLGDNSLNKEVNDSYRINGISHLFSISGMHISIITNILFFYLNRITHNKRIKYIIKDIFLILYLLFVGTSSLLRSTIMNILFSINFIFKLKIKKIDIMCITLIISIIINPFIIYDIGFIYSYIISFYLILFQPKIKTKNKLLKTLNITLISFIVSFPITIYNSYEINIISIFMNIVLVPIISILIFPLTILTLIFPVIDNILYFITNTLEYISFWVSNIEITKFIFPKPNLLIISLYYLIITIILNKRKYYYLIITLIIIHYIYPYFNNNLEIMMFDVGEADSILITYPYNKNNILIDTGKNEYIVTNYIIPYLKSRGIKKINHLIITHGDLDHIGGSISLINNFKVDKLILNKGEYSEYELELLNNLNKTKLINNTSKLKINNNYIYFLNNKIQANENDNSNVIYFEYFKYKFLFMGDSSFVVEDYLLDNYNLKDVSFLKVGHHGSGTSTTKEFVDKINPKISLISVGKNNYGHPNKEVLNNLSNSKIYRTDKNGSINCKITKNKIKLITYKNYRRK